MPAAACRLSWPVQALQQPLQAAWPGLQLQVLAEAGSTNTLLLEQARSPQPRATLLVAEAQTAGRGRLGRAWQAEAGASLTFSLGLPLAPRAPGRWQGLSLAVGLALADALDPAPARRAGQPPRIGLKWPNDLWLWDGPGQGRKLGGILIETSALEGAAAGPRWCVVGVGLNIAPQAGAPAWLQLLQPAATPPSVLAAVALPLLQALLRFEAQGFAPLAAAYAQRDLLCGQALHTSHGLAGEGAGVDAQGALLLRNATGLHPIVSGEVSVRFAGQPLPGAVPC
jgi:BirA family biotin operon repressor/biotin-[acetyl-CoA-carboxylase] ligase